MDEKVAGLVGNSLDTFQNAQEDMQRGIYQVEGAALMSEFFYWQESSLELFWRC